MHTLFKPSSDDDTIYFVCGVCKDNKKYLYRFETRTEPPKEKGTYNKKVKRFDGITNFFR